MFHYCLIMKGRCLGFSVNSDHPPQPQKVLLKTAVVSREIASIVDWR